MNSSKAFVQINFNPFLTLIIPNNPFNDHDQQDMRDPDLNYYNDLNSNNFDSAYFLEENVKRYLSDIKKCNSLLFMLISWVMNSNFEKLHDLL